MLRPADEFAAQLERRIFRKTIAFFGAFSILFAVVGVAIGVFWSGSRTNANEPLTANVPESMSTGFVDVARRVEPAVVNIDTKSKIPEPTVRGERPDSSKPNDILDFFQRQSRTPSYSVGSGFIVEKTGYILTNFHVIDDASRITVRLQNGEEYVAKVIGTDEETDLAVLKIEAGKELPSVKLGDSGATQVGDWVLAIGSPFGLAQTVTAGIISQTNRETPSGSIFQKFVQTDAAINRGNSGGPLVNMRGEVIGVNSQIATSTGDYNGIGFALPSNEASYVFRQIIANGRVRRGYLGVNLDTIKPEFGKVYEMPDLKGALVTNVADRESRAAKAGLQVNDVIIGFNGEPVESHTDLIAKVASTEPEQEISLDYVREVDNKLQKQTIRIKLGERPSATRAGNGDDEPKKLTPSNAKPAVKPLGLTVEPLSPERAKTAMLEGQTGLVIKDIDPASFIIDIKNSAGRRVLSEGDVIQRINRVSVTDPAAFGEIVGKLKTGDAIVLHIAYYNRPTRSVQQRIVSFTVQ